VNDCGECVTNAKLSQKLVSKRKIASDFYIALIQARKAVNVDLGVVISQNEKNLYNLKITIKVKRSRDFIDFSFLSG